MVQREWDGMAPPPPSPQIQAQELSMSTASTSAILIKPEPSTSLQNEQTLRAEMVKQFSHFTGMKPDWAEKCLQDCSWNWDVRFKHFFIIFARFYYRMHRRHLAISEIRSHHRHFHKFEDDIGMKRDLLDWTLNGTMLNSNQLLKKNHMNIQKNTFFYCDH